VILHARGSSEIPFARPHYMHISCVVDLKASCERSIQGAPRSSTTLLDLPLGHRSDYSTFTRRPLSHVPALISASVALASHTSAWYDSSGGRMSATPMSGQLGSMKWRIVRSLDCGRAGGRGVSTAVQPVGELEGRGEKEAHLPQEKVAQSRDARGADQDVEGRGCRRI